MTKNGQPSTKVNVHVTLARAKRTDDIQSLLVEMESPQNPIVSPRYGNMYANEDMNTCITCISLVKVLLAE